MKSVMVDNWFLENAFMDRFISSDMIYQEYGKLLSAIVLWDEIYYPQNEMSRAWGAIHYADLESVLKPYDDGNYFYKEEAEGIYTSEFADSERNIVATGAIRYLLLSNEIGVDYFPSSARSLFLQKYGVGSVLDKLSRLDFFKPLDKSINEYFEELNDKFGKTIFTIKRPVLVDFIIHNTPQNMSYVEYALHLKQEGPVVQFRNYLDDLEKALQKNEWKVLSEILKYSDSVVSKVLDMDKKNTASIDFAIAPVPSLSISKSLSINIKNVQLSFLEDLARFAFSGRKYQ